MIHRPELIDDENNQLEEDPIKEKNEKKMWNPIDPRFFLQEDSEDEEITPSITVPSNHEVLHQASPSNHEVFHQALLADPAEAIMTTGLTLGLGQGGGQGRTHNQADTEIIAEESIEDPTGTEVENNSELEWDNSPEQLQLQIEDTDEELSMILNQRKLFSDNGTTNSITSEPSDDEVFNVPERQIDPNARKLRRRNEKKTKI